MIFAKAPTPGLAKTRLIPALGPERAARLQAAFLLDVLARHRRPQRHCTVWRAGEHPIFAALGVPVAEQVAGDLGQRQAAAFADELVHGQPVVVVGTDSPTLPPELVDLAFAHLARVPAVVGPARDGGYYLLGLGGVDPAALPAVFAGIPWSSERTCAELLAALGRAEIPCEILPFWYDIDEPDDLAALTERRFLLSPPLPLHTLAALDDP